MNTSTCRHADTNHLDTYTYVQTSVLMLRGMIQTYDMHSCNCVWKYHNICMYVHVDNIIISMCMHVCMHACICMYVCKTFHVAKSIMCYFIIHNCTFWIHTQENAHIHNVYTYASHWRYTGKCTYTRYTHVCITLQIHRKMHECARIHTEIYRIHERKHSPATCSDLWLPAKRATSKFKWCRIYVCMYACMYVCMYVGFSATTDVTDAVCMYA